MGKALLPGELLEFFNKNRTQFNTEAICVASDELTGIDVWLTERCGYPYFAVMCDGENLYEVNSTSSPDAVDTYRAILRTYITNDNEDIPLVSAKAIKDEPVEDPDVPDIDNDSIMSDEDYVRSDQIACAVYDMVDLMVDGCIEDLGISGEDIDDIAIFVEKFIYDNYGIAIEHSMVLTDENGQQYVEKYPWDPNWMDKE